MGKISLVALYYQGKDEELMGVLKKSSMQSNLPQDQRVSFDVDECNRFGKSMLNIAIKDRNKELALELMRAGADFLKADKTGEYPLFLAVYSGLSEVACTMIAQMVPDTDCDYWFNKLIAPYHERPIIFEAIYFVPILRAMLNAGGDPLAVNATLETPLELGIEAYEYESVRLMLGHLPKGMDKAYMLEMKKLAIMDPELSDILQEYINRL